MFKLNGKTMGNSRVMVWECSSNDGICLGFRAGINDYSVEFYTDSRKGSIYEYLNNFDVNVKTNINNILDDYDVTVWCLNNEFDPDCIEYCEFYLTKKTDDEFMLFVSVRDYEYNSQKYNYDIEVPFRISEIEKRKK